MQFCSGIKFRIPVWLNCLAWFKVFRADISNPANICTFQVTNRNRKRCGYVYIVVVNFGHILHFFPSVSNVDFEYVFTYWEKSEAAVHRCSSQ